MNELELAPVKEVIGIIDSCINEGQLETCDRLKKYYARKARNFGVVNPEDIERELTIKIEEKREELRYAEAFLQ